MGERSWTSRSAVRMAAGDGPAVLCARAAGEASAGVAGSAMERNSERRMERTTAGGGRRDDGTGGGGASVGTERVAS